ncbi:YigZ family protein [Clostridium paridis]|uniref:YigZ family protein n=1 Tax=Clostridium paridis TaxID=2803863 RepID=A0A937K395_9CLOT|nr:YigZ family protein [Clostridium paridis]MBL4932186.1 YigZ family protein [Clostridium paridis]
MSYLTIKKQANDEFDEKKSQFIGYIKRVESEDEAKEFVQEIKNMHKMATHNCWAYVIGENLGIQRYSDDGEPQGTAGIPILEVIKKTGLTDCAIVVTRYFGGIMLGAGGLTRAYTKGASIAIKAGGIVEKVKGMPIDIKINYDLLGKVQYICGENNWTIENTDYTEDVKITLILELEEGEKAVKEIMNTTNGKAVINKGNIGIYFKEQNRLFESIDN